MQHVVYKIRKVMAKERTSTMGVLVIDDAQALSW